ncbi:hypothetical protein K438DRAFT_410521 [Mycena galopus ATCC 62051]|nr:hypothetical protein K438DRAFT_410521 [Mycena galopus ATCC 62051]
MKKKRNPPKALHTWPFFRFLSMIASKDASWRLGAGNLCFLPKPAPFRAKRTGIISSRDSSLPCAAPRRVPWHITARRTRLCSIVSAFFGSSRFLISLAPGAQDLSRPRRWPLEDSAVVRNFAVLLHTPAPPLAADQKRPTSPNHPHCSLAVHPTAYDCPGLATWHEHAPVLSHRFPNDHPVGEHHVRGREARVVHTAKPCRRLRASAVPSLASA